MRPITWTIIAVIVLAFITCLLLFVPSRSRAADTSIIGTAIGAAMGAATGN